MVGNEEDDGEKKVKSDQRYGNSNVLFSFLRKK